MKFSKSNAAYQKNRDYRDELTLLCLLCVQGHSFRKAGRFGASGSRTGKLRCGLSLAASSARHGGQEYCREHGEAPRAMHSHAATASNFSVSSSGALYPDSARIIPRKKRVFYFKIQLQVLGIRSFYCRCHALPRRPRGPF